MPRRPFAQLFAIVALLCGACGRQRDTGSAASAESASPVHADGLVFTRLWDHATSKVYKDSGSDRAQVIQLVFAPDGRHICTLSDDGLLVWDVASSTVTRRLVKPAVWSVSYAPDSRTLACAVQNMGRPDYDGPLIWDTATGNEIRRLKHPAPFSPRDTKDVAFAQEGSTLVSQYDGDLVCVWDTKSWKLQRDFFIQAGGHAETGGEVGADSVSSLSRNGKFLTATSRGLSVEVYDVSQGTLFSEDDANGVVCSICFSPDTRLVATGRQNRLSLWDFRARKRVADLPCDGSLFAAAFSPDGRFVAAVSEHGVIYVWDANSKSLQHTIETHLNLTGFCHAGGPLAFSPDSRSIALGGRDSTILVWRLTR